MDWTQVGSLATAAGVLFAAGQVKAQRTQFRTSFQDDLWREQREIISGLPIEFVLMPPGAAGFDPERLGERELSLLYRYFDLCNEEALFARLGRVGANTWYTWSEGIVHNMRRPAFAHAWTSVGGTRAASEFRELAAVLEGRHHLPWRRDPLGRIRRRAQHGAGTRQPNVGTTGPAAR